jgi:hypothetical protein
MSTQTKPKSDLPEKLAKITTAQLLAMDGETFHNTRALLMQALAEHDSPQFMRAAYAALFDSMVTVRDSIHKLDKNVQDVNAAMLGVLDSRKNASRAWPLSSNNQISEEKRS